MQPGVEIAAGKPQTVVPAFHIREHWLGPVPHGPVPWDRFSGHGATHQCEGFTPGAPGTGCRWVLSDSRLFVSNVVSRESPSQH